MHDKSKTVKQEKKRQEKTESRNCACFSRQYTIRMNKKSAILLLAVIFTLLSPAFCEEEQKSGDVGIPPGMEVRKISDVNVLVPRGAILHKVDDVIVLESAEEYSARRFMEVGERLDRIEEQLRKFNDYMEKNSKKAKKE